MKLNFSGLTSVVSHSGLVAAKNSPQLLMGGGILSMVASTVFACRATLKLEEVLERAELDLTTAKTLDHENYSENDRKKDIAIIYTRTTVDMAKLYGPSLILGAAGVFALTKSHSILQDRNVALTAAYVAVDKAFSEYRTRVVEKYGEDEDREFRYSSEKIKIKDEETGKTISTIRVGPGEQSMYARFFDELSSSWNKEPEYNFTFIRAQQNWFNDLLKARGHVFLNEVYDSLGIPRSKAGQAVGWVLGTEGDNYIDFGLWDVDSTTARDFVNGREGAILLDFNVDGVIYDKIEEVVGSRRRGRRLEVTE